MHLLWEMVLGSYEITRDRETGRQSMMSRDTTLLWQLSDLVPNYNVAS
jgi:hypothetical protein